MRKSTGIDLDAEPLSAEEAATWLHQVADICARSGLLNVARRVRAVGRWANGTAALDALLVQPDERSSERTSVRRPAPRRSRSTAKADREAQVREALAALKRAGGVLRTSEIATALGVHGTTACKVVALAKQRKLVEYAGGGPTRRICLPGTRRAKEAP